MRVLLCGESWVTHSLHIKGVDSFSTSSYVEGAGHLRAALAGADMEIDYLPGHLVPGQFPATLGDLLDHKADAPAAVVCGALAPTTTNGKWASHSRRRSNSRSSAPTS
jgi:uncharacterized membrane protein